MFRPASPNIPANLSQVRLIRNLNLFLANTPFGSSGMRMNTIGVCAGLVTQYLKHKARGTEREFFADLEFVSNLKPDQYERDAGRIASFCQAVGYSFDPGAFNKTDRPRQGDIDKILRAENTVIEPVFRIGIRMDTGKLSELWSDIIKEDQMVFLASTNHAIGAYKKNNKYYLYDPNSKEGEKVYHTLEEFDLEVKRNLAFNGESADLFIKIFQDKKSSPVPSEPFKSKSYFADKISLKHDTYLLNSLSQSVEVNDLGMVDELLKNKGADPYDPTDNKPSAFELSCALGLQGIVERILEDRANKPDKDIYTTALMKCLQNGHEKTSKYMIQYAFAEYPDLLKNILKTLFDNACIGGNVSVIEMLFMLDESKSLMKEKTISNGVMLAANNIHTEAVKFLLSKLPQKDPELQEKVLLSAIDKDNYSLFVEMSKSAKLNENHLKRAISAGATRHINVMLDKGMEITLQHIKLAAGKYNIQLIRQLLAAQKNHGPAIAPVLSLLQGAMSGDRDKGKELLRRVPDKKFQQDLLLSALTGNHYQLTAVLKSFDVKVDGNDIEAGKLLVEYCKNGDRNAVMMLLTEGIRIDQTADVPTPNGNVPLNLIETAMHFRHYDIVMALVKEKLPLSADDLENVLLFAASHGQNQIIEQILKNYQVNLNQYSLLSVAAQARQIATVGFLLDNGVVLQGSQTVFALCRAGDVSLMQDAIKRRPAIRDEFTSFDITMQFLTASRNFDIKQMECLTLLQPVEKDTLNEEVAFALSKGKTEQAVLLFKLGAVLDEKQSADFLRQASEERNPEGVNLLLQHGAKLKPGESLAILAAAYSNQGDSQPKSAEQILELASLYGHEAVYAEVKKLLPVPTAAQPSLQVGTLFGQNPAKALYRACRIGDLHLLENLVTVKKMDFSSQLEELLEVAAIHNHRAVVVFLASRLSPVKLNQQLEVALNSGTEKLVSILREVIKPIDLTANLKAKLAALPAAHNNSRQEVVRNISGISPNKKT